MLSSRLSRTNHCESQITNGQLLCTTRISHISSSFHHADGAFCFTNCIIPLPSPAKLLPMFVFQTHAPYLPCFSSTMSSHPLSTSPFDVANSLSRCPRMLCTYCHFSIYRRSNKEQDIYSYCVPSNCFQRNRGSNRKECHQLTPFSREKYLHTRQS